MFHNRGVNLVAKLRDLDIMLKGNGMTRSSQETLYEQHIMKINVLHLYYSANTKIHVICFYREKWDCL